MRTSKLVGLIILLIVVISLVTVWAFPSLQDFMAGNTMWNGVKDFTTEFKAQTLEAVSDLPAAPEKNILVTIPYVDYDEGALAAMRRFVADGGTMLLMDDFGYGNTFLAYIGSDARFANTLLLDPLFNYKNQYLPRITDFTPAIRDMGITVIGLNHATTLTGVADSQVMAWSSEMSYLDGNNNGSRDSGEPGGPFAVVAELNYGKGTLFLISDPSLVINTMVRQNDNRALARYLVNVNGEPETVLLDIAHLTKTPLDVSKLNLESVRKIISHPYALIGTTALVFVIIAGYVYKRGLIIG